MPSTEPDLAGLHALLAEDKFVGLQLPATTLATPAAWERAAGLLLAVEMSGKAVFIHPGAEQHRPQQQAVPAWWHPTVGYVAQMNAAWWGWKAFDGRASLPNLKVVFGAGAGLAPIHQERQIARGGADSPIDPHVYVDTASYGPRALDSLVRVLGIDALVLGSDRPYGEPIREFLGKASTTALRVSNPQRLITPSPTTEVEWAVAS